MEWGQWNEKREEDPGVWITGNGRKIGGKNIGGVSGFFANNLFAFEQNTEAEDMGGDAVSPGAAPECSRNQDYIAPITLPQTNFRKHQKEHRNSPFWVMKYYAETTCGRHIMFNPESDDG